METFIEFVNLSLPWLGSAFQWFITSLRLSENGLIYISGLMVVVVIVMFVLLIKAKDQVNRLTNQNDALRSQINYVRSQINLIHQEQQKEKGRQNTQAMFDLALGLLEWFSQ
ncbi:hypothetical protein ACKFKG_22040 [Phormidesmis sp. 146-35]